MSYSFFLLLARWAFLVQCASMFVLFQEICVHYFFKHFLPPCLYASLEFLYDSDVSTFTSFFKFYLFIFGCVGSSLLHAGFL